MNNFAQWNAILESTIVVDKQTITFSWKLFIVTEATAKQLHTNYNNNQC